MSVFEEQQHLLTTADYVISIDFPIKKKGTSSIDPSGKSSANLSKLLSVLNDGRKFDTQIRPGQTSDSLIVFVRVRDNVLFKRIQSMKIKEFLYFDDDKVDVQKDINNPMITRLQRSYVVYQMLTSSLNEGGLGLTPGIGEWSFIKRIIPIYTDSKAANSLLLNKFIKRIFVKESDIDEIKELAGEKVGLYFHFLNHYFNWLSLLSVFGLACHVFLGRYSIIYTVFAILWGVLFVNSWNYKQYEISLKWGTKGNTKVLGQLKRADFKGESNEIDPVTNEFKAYYPDYKRTFTQIGFIPVALSAICALFIYQFVCFLIEIFLNEIYQGPGKAVLGLVPTVLLVVGIPLFTQVYQKMVKRYMILENHEFQETYQKSFLEKMYVYIFLAQYSALFITILFYIPMGYTVNWVLPWIHQNTNTWGIPINHESFMINKGRLLGQYNYFIVTNQIIGMLTENVVPEIISMIKAKFVNEKDVDILDSSAECDLLNSVRGQLSKPSFDTDAEYRELSVHFGYIILFSTIWPLAPLISLVFLWIELRGDLYKLLHQSSKPVPENANETKPWTGNIRFLVWLGSIVMPLITFMYRDFDKFVISEKYNFLRSSLKYVSGYKLFFVVFASENILYIWANQIVESLTEILKRKSSEAKKKGTVLVRRQILDKMFIEEPKDDFSYDSLVMKWEKCDMEKELLQAASLPGLLQAAKETKKGMPTESLRDEKEQLSTNNTTGVSRFNQENDSTITNRRKALPTEPSKTSKLPLETSNVSAVKQPTVIKSPLLKVSTDVSSSGSSHVSLNGATLPPNFPLDSASRKKQRLEQAMNSSTTASTATAADDSTIVQSNLNVGSDNKTLDVSKEVKSNNIIDKSSKNSSSTVEDVVTSANAVDEMDSLTSNSPKFQRVEPVSDLKDLEFKPGEFTSTDADTPSKNKKKSVFGIIKKKVANAGPHLHSNSKKNTKYTTSGSISS